MGTRVGIASLVVMASVVGVLAFGLDRNQARGELTTADIAARADSSSVGKAAQARVFFGHQSVGGNVLGGVPGAFRAAGAASSPAIVEVPVERADPGRVLAAYDAGFIAHAFIGENGNPSSKIKDFDALLRSGVASAVDVAMMKFCYVDITADTDVEALFADYVEALDDLERDYPDVTFVHVTTPVTVAPPLKTRIKAFFGMGATSNADNAAREHFNTMLRERYDQDQVFDLASIESTAPDGSRISGDHDGQRLYALYEGYAADDGHLNDLASQLAAVLWLAAIERAQR